MLFPVQWKPVHPRQLYFCAEYCVSSDLKPCKGGKVFPRKVLHCPCLLPLLFLLHPSLATGAGLDNPWPDPGWPQLLYAQVVAEASSRAHNAGVGALKRAEGGTGGWISAPSPQIPGSPKGWSSPGGSCLQKVRVTRSYLKCSCNCLRSCWGLALASGIGLTRLHKVIFGPLSHAAPSAAETKSAKGPCLLLAQPGCWRTWTFCKRWFKLLEKLFQLKSSCCLRQGIFFLVLLSESLSPSVTGAKQAPSPDISFMDKACIVTYFKKLKAGDSSKTALDFPGSRIEPLLTQGRF